MKTIFKMMAFICTCIASVNAQVNDFIITGTQEANGCAHNVLISFQVGSLPETGATVYVNWGDGTSTGDLVISTLADTTVFRLFQHSYAVAGTYNVSVNVIGGNGMMVVPSGNPVLQLTAQSPGNCGYIYIETFSTSPNIDYNSAPYDFTGNDGSITTIAGNSIANVNYTGLNTSNAPYIVSLNDAWLLANGLVQVTPDFQIVSFDANGQANPSVQTVIVDCNVTSTNPDFDVSLWGSNFVAPLQSGNLYLNVCNYACGDTSDAIVSLTLPAGFVPVTAGLTNATFVGNVLSFTLLSLSDCAYKVIPVTFPGATNAGTVACFSVIVDATNEVNFSNNADSTCVIVLNSYDPNDKTVDRPEIINPNAREELTYVIQFQNDGNFPALDVVVRDTLSANLDVSTFELVYSKHAVATTINPTTRVATFSFNAINLAASSTNLAASQGQFVYKIKENVALPYGTEIKNTAYIYFDFNPAIVTNTTLNRNITQSSASIEANSNVQISMYPNPANDRVFFGAAQISEVTIFDLSGKIVKTQTSNFENGVGVNDLSNGLYQVAITTNTGTSAQKLIIQK